MRSVFRRLSALAALAAALTACPIGSVSTVGDADDNGRAPDARVPGNADGGVDARDSGSAVMPSGDGGAADAGVSAVDGGASGVTELIHYYGRWNRLTDRAITVNTGSHVVAQFSGTDISAKFDTSLNQTPNPTLAWRIDQGTWQEGELAAAPSLGTGLSAGTHEVTLMVRGLNESQSRWSPPLVASITLLGFDIVGGAAQPSLRTMRPKIEFLGDSITEGIAVWSSYRGQTTARPPRPPRGSRARAPLSRRSRRSARAPAPRGSTPGAGARAPPAPPAPSRRREAGRRSPSRVAARMAS
jgi:hypothetical protein